MFNKNRIVRDSIWLSNATNVDTIENEQHVKVLFVEGDLVILEIIKNRADRGLNVGYRYSILKNEMNRLGYEEIRNTKTVWINVYETGIHPRAHRSKELADKNTTAYRVACIEVEYEEGVYV